MTAPINPQRPVPEMRPGRPAVDAGALWAGGIATAIVAALVALVGVLACRWLLNIPILAPRQAGAYGDVHTTTLVVVAGVAALVATALAHLLLLSTPRPMSFFSWIVGLAIVLAILFTFQTSAPMTQRIATGVVYVVIGLAIGSLINGVGMRATRLRTRADGLPPPEYPADAAYREGYRDGAWREEQSL